MNLIPHTGMIFQTLVRDTQCIWLYNLVYKIFKKKLRCCVKCRKKNRMQTKNQTKNPVCSHLGIRTIIYLSLRQQQAYTVYANLKTQYCLNIFEHTAIKMLDNGQNPAVWLCTKRVSSNHMTRIRLVYYSCLKLLHPAGLSKTHPELRCSGHLHSSDM